MAGVKGAGGPPPKRADQRRRRNTPAAGKPVTAPAGEPPEAPEPDGSWHPIARDWYLSLAMSGQSAFYVQSDWLTAYAVAESMSREFKPQPIVGKDGEVMMVEMPPKAASLNAWLTASTQLLATEGARRRAAIELQRPRPAGEEEGGDVPHLDDARRRLRGSG